MAKGTISRSESKAFFDEVTGTKIRQITNHALIFTSDRTGDAQVFVAMLENSVP